MLCGDQPVVIALSTNEAIKFCGVQLVFVSHKTKRMNKSELRTKWFMFSSLKYFLLTLHKTNLWVSLQVENLGSNSSSSTFCKQKKKKMLIFHSPIQKQD
jgi:hypothetical protein